MQLYIYAKACQAKQIIFRKYYYGENLIKLLIIDLIYNNI